MFKKIILSLLIISVTTLCGCKKVNKTPDQLLEIKNRGRLIVGVKYDSKPFGYVDKDGKLKGYDVELAHMIAKQLLGNEKKVSFRQVNQHNRISKLNSGEVDMVIATMTITPQREAVVAFSVPYHTTGQALMVKKTSPIKAIGELNDKKVITILNTTGEKNLRYFAPNAIVQGYRTYEDGFEALRAKKADAMTADESILVGLALDNPQYKVLPQRYTNELYAIAFRKGKKSQGLKNDVDNILLDFRKKGALNQLKHKWIPMSYENDTKMKKLLNKTPRYKDKFNRY